MDDSKKIRLYDFKDTDQIVFTTLLSLLSYKTSQNWEIINNGNGDIVVVDFDSNEGPHTATALEKTGIKVVGFGSAPENKKNALWLNKPLRAGDILRCLNNISETEVGHKNRDNAKANIHFVRLRRWPSKEILSVFPGSSRLCAVLMNHTVTAEKAAKIAHLPLDKVIEFIDKCKAANCIEETGSGEDPPTHKVGAGTKNTNLLNKLRLKFRARV